MICDTCPRTLQNYTCEQPCELYMNELNNQSLVGVSFGIENKSEVSSANLEDYMEYDVFNPEWLDIINGKMTIEKAIDYDGLLNYMELKNEEYCNAHNLCPKCHSKLVEMRDKSECFGREVEEKYLVCPYCRE